MGENDNLAEKDISHEVWREYEWEYKEPITNAIVKRVYRIYDPVSLYIRIKPEMGTTHRVVDADGVAHCIPAVGLLGCALRWKNHDGEPPVNF